MFNDDFDFGQRWLVDGSLVNTVIRCSCMPEGFFQNTIVYRLFVCHKIQKSGKNKLIHIVIVQDIICRCLLYKKKNYTIFLTKQSYLSINTQPGKYLYIILS